VMKNWYLLFLAIILAACTDYVNQIEDERDEWRNAQELAALSSSKRSVSSSSIIPTILWKSSSSEQSTQFSSGTTKSSSSIASEKSSSSPILSSSREKMSSSEDFTSSSSNVNVDSLSSSSSDEILSSSSSEDIASSSSGKASWAYLNPAISYGEMIDSRDGQVYKTVVIGEQTWMAENLNLETNNGSFCYNNEESYCAKYGRLYTWGVSMDSAGLYSDGGNGCGYIAECSPTYPVRGICPDGWHLPSKEEWDVILDKLKVDRESEKTLLSASELDCHCGSDKYGLSILGSAGRDYSGKNFGGASRTAFFQTSSLSSNTGTHSYTLYINADIVNPNVYASMTEDWSRLYAFSVRCLKNSSNTVLISSSSTVAEVSSSSTSVVPPCKTLTEDNCEYGTLLDLRDNRTYKTVKIGEQVWMAENLNYQNNMVEGRYCYNDDPSYCSLYGHLYTWSIAQNSCPDGWHLPSVGEFNSLLESIGGDSVAGTKLKSTSGWSDNGNGSDEYGFSALPAGTFDGFWTFKNLSSKTDFWASDSGKGLYMGGDTDKAQIALFGSSSYGFSVRCIKD